ncbi:MAG: metallophosphoesterase family protein [Victivallales bacterium]
MLLGIIGDIHGNIEALTSCYKTIKEAGCDKIVCTGDIVGYGASPRECIDFVQDMKIESIRGNHDHYTTQHGSDWDIQPCAKKVILWMQQTLPKAYISWLDTLPYHMEVEGVQFVHSSLEGIDGKSWPYILSSQSALFHFFLQSSKFCFYGHTHIPLIFTLKHGNVSIEMLTSRNLRESNGEKFLLNPGSVGQPRDFDSRAAAVIFDTKSHELRSLRAKYNIEHAQLKILAAGLPMQSAERLSSGQ